MSISLDYFRARALLGGGLFYIFISILPGVRSALFFIETNEHSTQTKSPKNEKDKK